MIWTNKYLIFIAFFFLLPQPVFAQSESPACTVGLAAPLPPSVCAAGEIDMLHYFIGTANNTNLTKLGQEKYGYLPHSSLGEPIAKTPSGKDKFWIIKNNNQAVYEEFSYDDQYIYHLKDTSWATGPHQDVKCNSGAPAGFTMLEGCPATGEDIGTPVEGIPWTPRCVTAGEELVTPAFEVVGFDKTNCVACDAPYTTLGTNPSCTARHIKIFVEDTTFASGISISDAVRVEILDGPGKGENYWYSEEHGWVAFGWKDNPQDYVVDFGPPRAACLSPDPEAGGNFACQPFNGFYGNQNQGTNLNIYGAQQCIAAVELNVISSRPFPCATCLNYVPEPTISCAGNITYTRSLKYTSFNTASCDLEQCRVNEATCQLEYGTDGNYTPIAELPDITPENELIVGPIPWKGRFTLLAEPVIQPFAGNDNEESRERYIADYLDGALFYKTPISPASSIPSARYDPKSIYSLTATNYFDLDPRDPRFISYTGVIPKLAPQEYLDELKHELLDRVGNAGLIGSVLPVHDYTIGYSWGGSDVTKLSQYNLDRNRRKPLRRDYPTHEEYQTALDAWTDINWRWSKLWTYVPVASRDDTPGRFNPIPQNPAAIVPLPQGNNGGGGGPPPPPGSPLGDLAAEIDEFFAAGASGYLAWQYSGEAGLGQEFASDPYSFFKNRDPGPAICGVLKSKSGSSQFIGVNMWDAGDIKHQAKLVQEFTYLKNECGVTVIRTFAKAGGAAGAGRVVAAAASAGVKAIIAIGDYSNGGTPGLPGGVGSDWFTTGYAGEFQSFTQDVVAQTSGHAGLYGYEIANEIHCRGDDNALNDYTNNVGVDIGGLLRGGSGNVGYGQKASENTTKCDSPGVQAVVGPGNPTNKSHFEFSNSISQITMTSGHFYNQAEKTLALLALQQSQGLGKPYYVGEAPAKRTSTTSNLNNTNALALQVQTPNDDQFASILPFSPTVDSYQLTQDLDPGSGGPPHSPLLNDGNSDGGIYQPYPPAHDNNKVLEVIEVNGQDDYQLQFPHLARLYESAHIMNQLLSPYSPSTNRSNNSNPNPNPNPTPNPTNGPTPTPDPNGSLIIYPPLIAANTTIQGTGVLTGNIATDPTQNLIFEYQLTTHPDDGGNLNNYRTRFAASGPVTITLSTPSIPLRNHSQDFPPTSTSPTTYQLPGPGNYYLKNGNDTILIWIDALSVASAPAGATIATLDSNDPNALPNLINNSPAGSTISIPAGTYISKRINIEKPFHLYLSPGARIIGTDNIDDYELGSDDKRALLYINGDNITVSGPGGFDANGTTTFNNSSGRSAYNAHIRQTNNTTIKDVLFFNSSTWGVVVREKDTSSMLTLDNIKIFSMKDGFDLRSAKNVTLSNFYIQSVDDGIALKSDAGDPSGGFLAKNGIINSSASALKIGTEMADGGIDGATFENITVYDGDRGINIANSTSKNLNDLQFNNLRFYLTSFPGNNVGSLINTSEHGSYTINMNNIYAQIKHYSFINSLNTTININNLKLDIQEPFPGNTGNALFQVNEYTARNSKLNLINPIVNWNGHQSLYSGLHSGNGLVTVTNLTEFSSASPTKSSPLKITSTNMPTNLSSTTPTPILMASSQLFSPSINTVQLSQSPSLTTDSYQLAQNVPGTCLPANTGLAPGCYPNGGCHTVEIKINEKVSSNGQLNFCVTARNSCSTGGSIGDCDWYFNGGTLNDKSVIRIPDKDNTTICSNYNVGPGGMPPLNGTVGGPYTVSGYIRCERDIDQSCCNQEQHASCNYTVHGDGSVTSDCKSVAPPLPPAPQCAPTELSTVPQCSGTIRSGPGDNLCGQSSFDLIIGPPAETFWNQNTHNSIAIDQDDNTTPGDGNNDFESSMCGAAIACESGGCICDTSPPTNNKEFTGNCNITYACLLDGRTNLPNCDDCAGGCTQQNNECEIRCCGPNSTSFDNCEEPANVASNICSDAAAPNCGTAADPQCVVLPYGSEENNQTQNIAGNRDLTNFYQPLTYSAEREIHLATEVPYLGTIYQELIGFPSESTSYDKEITPIFRSLTPYRGETTAPDKVPWYLFHSGDASGDLTIRNLGPSEDTNINGQQTLTQPFFFPFLGAIQDATQFMRDCLTAPYPNGCTGTTYTDVGDDDPEIPIPFDPPTNGECINEGDPFAVMGNSGAPGCSTGAHLHFGVYDQGIRKNPAFYLNPAWPDANGPTQGPYGGGNLTPPTGIGSIQQWRWPMNQRIIITQYYGPCVGLGCRYYTFHTGLDMVGTPDTTIYAVQSGVVRFSRINCDGSLLNIARLHHINGSCSDIPDINNIPANTYNGIITEYQHIQNPF